MVIAYHRWYVIANRYVRSPGPPTTRKALSPMDTYPSADSPIDYTLSDEHPDSPIDYALTPAGLRAAIRPAVGHHRLF